MNPPSASAHHIGIEIANGVARVARVNGAGRAVARDEHPLVTTSVETIVGQLTAAVHRIDGAGAESARAVGVAIPGIVASDRVSLSAHLAVLDGVPLGGELARRLGRPVLLENDANAAALAEAWQGAGREGRSVLYVSLGVGIGAGVVIDGLIWSGPSGYAGEIGHLQVDESGTLCGCGLAGCLETVVGADGWVRRARGALRTRSSKKLDPATVDQAAIVAAAAEGDRIALDVLHGAGQALGRALAAAIVLLNLDRVVIGGGPAACPMLLDEVIAEARRRTLPRAFAGCVFRLSALGEGACVLGAARVARAGTLFGNASRRQAIG